MTCPDCGRPNTVPAGYQKCRYCTFKVDPAIEAAAKADLEAQMDRENWTPEMRAQVAKWQANTAAKLQQAWDEAEPGYWDKKREG